MSATLSEPHKQTADNSADGHLEWAALGIPVWVEVGLGHGGEEIARKATAHQIAMQTTTTIKRP